MGKKEWTVRENPWDYEPMLLDPERECYSDKDGLQAIADKLNLFEEMREVLEISKRELEYLNDKPWEAETVNYIVNKIELLLNKIKG